MGSHNHGYLEKLRTHNIKVNNDIEEKIDIEAKIICENKPPLINQYGIIAINPNKYQNSNYKWAKTYITWITSEKGKKLINELSFNSNINNKLIGCPYYENCSYRF